MTETEISINPAVEIVPTANSDEAQLTKEVGALWQVHAQVQTSLKKTRSEMKLIRANLSHRLHRLKATLSKPGRAGAWSSFLATEKIPRSTADRLVRAHATTLAPQTVNCTSEHIPEPVETNFHKYLHALWPKLSRVLTSQESVELFIDELRRRAEKSFGNGA